MKAPPEIAARTGSTMASWSTDAIEERDRFSFWREAVCQSLFNLSPEASPGPFSGHMTARSSGQVRFVLSESTRYQFTRTQRDIASAPSDHYSIYLQLRGETVISQGDESFLFQPNDIGISDGRVPFSVALCDDRGRRAMAVVPRAIVDRRAPWLRQSPLHKLASNLPFADLAVAHLVRLSSNDISESATSLLTENLCNLLALASAPDVALDRLQPELQTEALLAFCRQNLHEPALSPRFVAARFGISVRTLHLRFEKLGQSFGRWLLENRLEACSKALRDPHQLSISISEIAYRWGFNDLSHFNKAFRARFGMAPSEMRAQIAARRN